MKTTTWLLPWKAKAELESLYAVIKDTSDDIKAVKEQFESIKVQLHTASTQLMECRKSEQEWRAAAEDHERALQVAVERVNDLSGRPENSVVVALNSELADVTEQLAGARRLLTERDQKISALEDMHEATIKAHEGIRNRAAMAEASAARVSFLERQLAEANLAIRKLREWITTTHRLDKPGEPNTIKQMLENAQKGIKP